MFNTSDISSSMEVTSAEGVHIGTVDTVEGLRIRLKRAESQDGLHHYLSLAGVDRVEGSRVWLKDSADIPVGVY